MNNEEKRKLNKAFSTSETIVLVIISLIVGLSIGFLNNNKEKKETKKAEDKYLNEFIKNYNYVIDNYYEKVDKESLVNSAIAGMMESLNDPYSVYMDENQSNNFSITLNGSYEGLGVQITKDEKTGYMLITAILKNSPAEKSILIPGDMIVSVDDKLSTNLSASEFSSLIKKSEKKEHKLKVLRDNKELEIFISKNLVTLASVVSEFYEQNNKKIGYIYRNICK